MGPIGSGVYRRVPGAGDQPCEGAHTASTLDRCMRPGLRAVRVRARLCGIRSDHIGNGLIRACNMRVIEPEEPAWRR
jgi:hypothetical protein